MTEPPASRRATRPRTVPPLDGQGRVRTLSSRDGHPFHDSTNARGVPEPQTGQPDPASAAPDDASPPLVALIASIRAAVAKGASPEARAAGATACRSILTVLEANPGQSLASNAQPAGTLSPIAALLKQPGFLTQLAAMSREQLLDLLKQVTGAMPTRPQTPSSNAPRFHLIQIPQARRPDGT